jgi:hypothetical protein
MNPLDKIRESLRQQIESQDVSDALPAHDAFEVEDLVSHDNFAFVKAGNVVLLFNTSRDKRDDYGKYRCMQCFGPNTFPFGAKTAEEYYNVMYRKALNATDNICFMGYVDPDTFDPIDKE